MKRWRLAGVVVATVFALATAGCSSKKKGSELEGQGGAGASGGISDQALGGGSLALAQQGRLGAATPVRCTTSTSITIHSISTRPRDRPCRRMQRG